MPVIFERAKVTVKLSRTTANVELCRTSRCVRAGFSRAIRGINVEGLSDEAVKALRLRTIIGLRGFFGPCKLDIPHAQGVTRSGPLGSIEFGSAGACAPRVHAADCT
ncbi:hypothetical protein EVAR_100801_1 [Eumeta japonica]|uniref:Uncharacterized protein n=1 Tax=Eumeta variegata TaxID=151549 RepID=A0A4C2A1U7_EUMVA|nr:hypothetical protein EVAR_100801_1 [Eumeta japonica]